MKAIEVLVEEHKRIVRGSECLGRMIAAAMPARRLKFLQAEAIIDFIASYADGWHHAKEENVLLPRVAARRPAWETDHIADLVQEGNVGLVQAVKKFDPYRGVKFSYYAAYWIRAYILKFIMDNWRLVKIGTTQAQRKLFFSLNKEKKLLEAQGFQPEVKLLAQRLNVKESEVIEMSQRMDGGDLSLESPVRDDSNDQQKDFIQSGGLTVEELVANDEIKVRLALVLDKLKTRLNSKEMSILADRLLSDEPQTLQEIADQFGISRERVRQIETNLLHKMRKFFEDEVPDIKTFLDEAVDFWHS